MNFAESLKRERMRSGLSQAELAEMLGVTQGVISMYENGSKVPTVPLAVKIAQTLGTTCEAMCKGDVRS